jgi:cephalosporin-C deacetylase-like acetyl esterase
MQGMDFKTSVNKPDGIFGLGEEIILTAELLDNGNPVTDRMIEYKFFRNGQVTECKKIKSDTPICVKTSLDVPGWTHISAVLLDDNGKPAKNQKISSMNIQGDIGAVVDPSHLEVVAAEPPDFDAFWMKQRKELDLVPLNASRQEIPMKKAELVDQYICYDVKVDCAGAKPVSGYLVIPRHAAPKSLPAYVTYHPYGVYSAKQQAEPNAICFDVNAHGILNGQSAEYYKKTGEELGWYPAKGKNDPDQYYFKDMYLRVMRALDYVKSLPEWDGKTIIVSGGSQGGGQAIIAAALDPQVTLCKANVPAMGDLGGILAGRKSGWPGFYGIKNGKPDNAQAGLTAGYFDNANFAKRIQCEVFLSAGFVDGIVAPTSVFVVYNSLNHAKTRCIESDPRGGHGVGQPKADKRIRELLKK